MQITCCLPSGVVITQEFCMHGVGTETGPLETVLALLPGAMLEYPDKSNLAGLPRDSSALKTAYRSCRGLEFIPGIQDRHHNHSSGF